MLHDVEAELRRSLRGEIRFDAGSKALYASDASNYRQIPLGVVVPADVDDLVAALAAYRVDENLRMGPSYKPVSLTTKLTFHSPEGQGFQRALERCIGMGKCRSLDGGTMCPSFRATREERFSTRGRAHLLWEMLQGEVIRDGWESEEIKQALDVCLACKGCQSDCPTHTDIASCKAEFLSHYYEKHWRPRQALLMGRIGLWAPWASRVSRLANFAMSAKPWSQMGKWVAGVAEQRDFPVFAPKSFSTLSRQNAAGRHVHDKASGRKVILWVDTFNEHFSPQVAVAAKTVLERMGYDVVLPRKRLCCGRPLYHYGLLDEARALLRRVVRERADDICNGVPVVGLEPGCMSVFKDELLKQLPHDDLARRLSTQSFLFSDFAARSPFEWPRFDANVMVHGHCHQKSLFGMKGDTDLLQKLGVRWQLLDTGCCGMAGSFGFNADHHELSIKIGEDKLLPLVRHAPHDTLIVTNGFSCREQIGQAAGRHTLHIAELALRALTQETS